MRRTSKTPAVKNIATTHTISANHGRTGNLKAH